MKTKLLIIFVASIISACKKNIEQKFYVNYQVSINSGNRVAIYCYNDYYYDSGYQLKKNIYKADVNTWSSTHLADKTEAYYLRVEPDSLISDTVNLVVLVSVNDSVVSFKQSKTFKEPITLFGFINH